MKLMNLGVAIRRTEKKQEKVGSIIIPETASVKKKFREGEIVAVGPGDKNRKMEVNVGEKVVYTEKEYPQSEGCDIASLDDILYIF